MGKFSVASPPGLVNVAVPVGAGVTMSDVSAGSSAGSRVTDVCTPASFGTVRIALVLWLEGAALGAVPEPVELLLHADAPTQRAAAATEVASKRAWIRIDGTPHLLIPAAAMPSERLRLVTVRDSCRSSFWF